MKTPFHITKNSSRCELLMPTEIREILRLAQINHLEVIPLIQTFGHMEFVLKHKEFAHLREIPMYPNSLNPHREESHQLLHAMIRQVMELHPGLRWLHIGSDEVYYLGEGEESKKYFSKNGHTVEDLFICHLKKVASHVVSTYPGVKLISWDDMLRGASAQKLTGGVEGDSTILIVMCLEKLDAWHFSLCCFLSWLDSGVTKLVEPMIWDYTPNLDVENRVALIEKYSQSGFQKIWLASAFKGATGTSQQLTLSDITWKTTNVGYRWYRRYPMIFCRDWPSLAGRVLCELLPVGIPSLAVCLQTLKNGAYSDQVAASVQNVLGMSSLDTENYTCEASGSFPGSDVLILITQILFFLKAPTQEFLERNRFVMARFTEREKTMIHPIMVQQIEPEAVSLLSNWTLLLGDLQAALLKIFPDVTVDEWIEEHLMPYYVQLQQLVQDLNTALENQT
ncbi:unnamed protein product [Ranitomeya imitator]|uniref:beta-N-acetylhexosaminidase n=1 Tax=Ranitomeya imitator TaxID=111125 RepID=A0ABN9LBD6_9NEOB|nr:unnamed protein product [Ranitomeya imitator]